MEYKSASKITIIIIIYYGYSNNTDDYLCKQEINTKIAYNIIPLIRNSRKGKAILL